MALTALAGVGVAKLPRAWWRSTLVAGIWFVECCRIGIPLYVPPEPLVYRALAAMPDVRTVVELPMGLVESKKSWGLGSHANPAMWWQTLHRRDRTAGYLVRIPRHTVSQVLQTPVLGDLVVRTHNTRSLIDLDGRRREALHLPRYEPATIDRFLCDLAIDAFVLTEGATGSWRTRSVACSTRASWPRCARKAGPCCWSKRRAADLPPPA